MINPAINCRVYVYKMNMRKHFLIRMVICFSGAMFFLCSCTNTQKVIKQTHAFFVTLYPGIVAVDENGKEMPSKSQTKYSVYAVTGSDKVKWDTAWINGIIYMISAEKINPSPVFEVGINKQTGSKISITTRENEQLYLLHLNPVSTIPNTDAIPLKELMIKATFKGKVINSIITNITELTTPDPV